MVETPSNTLTFPVKDAVDVTIGIRRVREAGLLLGAAEVDQTLVATIISELASNIVKYAGRGTVRVNRVQANDGVDIEVWAADSGPGIADVEWAMRNHKTDEWRGYITHPTTCTNPECPFYTGRTISLTYSWKGDDDRPTWYWDAQQGEGIESGCGDHSWLTDNLKVKRAE